MCDRGQRSQFVTMGELVSPEVERNFVRYLQCVNSCRRICLEESFLCLYHAWSRRRHYGSLMEFCVEALGCRKESVLNLFSVWEGCDSVVRSSLSNPTSSRSPPSPFSTSSLSPSSPFSTSSLSPSPFSASPVFPESLYPQDPVEALEAGSAFPIPSTTSCVEAHLMKPRKYPFQRNRSFPTSALRASQVPSHPAARPRRSTMFSRTSRRSRTQESQPVLHETSVSRPKRKMSSKRHSLTSLSTPGHVQEVLPKPGLTLNVHASLPIPEHTHNLVCTPENSHEAPPTPGHDQDLCTARAMPGHTHESHSTQKHFRESNFESAHAQRSSSVLRDSQKGIGRADPISAAVNALQGRKPGQVLSLSPCGMLNAEPDPSLLSEDVLVIMLTEVFPQMPVRLLHLIKRLRRLTRTVCYVDIDFHAQHLEVRVQDLLDLTREIVWIVIENCSRVVEGHISDMAKKLQASKRRHEQAKKEYKEHVSLVAKTREELDEAQRELQHAQLKDREVKKNIKYLWSRSHSREAHEGSVKRSGSGVVAEARPNGELGNAARCSKYATVFHGESESTSLADDKDLGDMGGYEADAHDSGVEGSSISLLTSVMREVAVIERRHSTAGDVDDKLQKVLRSTRQSVLLTKKQMCQRLDSNVSAEQECITKEDVLNMRRAETVKLKNALKKLKRDCDSLKRGGTALIARLNATAEAICKGSLGDEETASAMAEVHFHRSDGSNKFLTEVRREAVSFASLVKVFSVQHWLATRQFTKQEVSAVYSNLKIKGWKGTQSVLDLLKGDVDAPPVIVISGPKGSGKTCLCHYILHQWRTNSTQGNARLREYDLVLYAALSDIASSESWSQYLREHVLCYTFKDYPNSSIYEEMKSMNALFLLDVGGAAREAIPVLKEILENLGRNRLLLTTRSGNEGEFIQVVKDHGTKYVLAEMCPMTPQAIKEYALQFFSLCENHKNSPHERVEQFSNLLSSVSINPTVLYPLPLAYLLYLWCINPNHLLFSTSVSSLFSRLLSVCQHRLAEVIKGDCGGHRDAARLAVEGNLQQLYRATKGLVADSSWPHDHQVLLEADHCLFKDPRVLWHFSPLVVVKSGANGSKQGLLVHPSLAEVLYGFFLADSLLLKSRSRIRRPRISALCRQEPRLLRDVLLHVVGSFLYSKHTLYDAKDVVSLYERSLHDKENMLAWLTLLKECNFTSNVCEAVSITLSSLATWVAARHSPETNSVVAELLRRGAYRPRLVVVTPDASDGERGEAVTSIIHALGTCSTTFVHLRQEAQFYTWGDETTSDALVVPLQPPGTLQECWGHLGLEGAMALRHCHHLEELNVRVSSLEALAALTNSIENQRRSLKYLYLRLDLPTSIPPASFQPLHFKGKKLWLRLRGITDSSATWVKDLTKRLNSWYTEVVLEESHLSPSVLHDLKEFMSHTPLHVSG